MSYANPDTQPTEELSAADGSSYWPSIADVMSAGALVLLLFMLLSYVQAVDFASTQRRIYQEMEEALTLELRILEELEASIGDIVGHDKVMLNRKDLSLNVQGEIFFDRGKSDIRSEARPVLDRLAAAFTKILGNSVYRSRVSAILIEGHCDETGTADVNWQLSVNRAVEVVRYLHRASPVLGRDYPRYFGAAGYSKFRPPAMEDGAPALQTRLESPEYQDMLARRIEIRIIPHHEGLREQIDRILKDRSRR